MKNFTRIFTFFLLITILTPMFGQKFYDYQWKKVEANYKSGKYKSNLPLILEIQNQAMKDDNTNQLIRSLKAEFSIVNQTQDDENNDSASQFFTKLSTFDDKLIGEQKLLFEVLLAEFFSDYYDNESWEINQRTNISSQDFSQIETWSKLDFKNFLSSKFTELEARKTDLQKVQLAKYKAVFEGTEDLDYFPTLWEWSAMKQIQFLSNSNFFTPNELKINHAKITTLYDELIAKNAGNAKLYFQHQKTDYNCRFLNCKDKFEQLQNLVATNSEGDYKVLIIAEMMDLLSSEQKFTEALQLAESAKNQYPKSKFLNNIKYREGQIVSPSLVIKYENHTQSDKPIHLVADAKNVRQFSLNIYEVKDDVQNFLKFTRNSYDKTLFPNIKKTLIRKEIFELQDRKDYKTHKTSLEIKPLPSGIYLAEYVVEGAIQEHFYFIATQSRLLYDKKNDRKPIENQLKLVNRENGQPVSNEGLKIYEYNGAKTVSVTSQSTDKAANIRFPDSGSKEYYRYYLVHQPQTNDYNLMQVYGDRNYGEIESGKQRDQAQIFLDRAIYRPGQTVYFKVINTKLLNEKESVAAGIPQKITLHDANGEEVSSQTFTTNEFGSYNGNFILPNGKLNGSFSLQIHGNNVDAYKSFQVEEYKRPKFEVTFEPVKDEYKYGQTIEVKGKAMMFAGVPLSNATVNYEIKKKNIRWMYFWWYPRGNDNENSILGDVKTNEKGEFTIRIDLKKDETLEGIQIDNFEINASVTDINGETQSETTNVKVASVSHYIKTDDIKDSFTDENVKIKVETKNYNDQNLKKPYQVKLSKLTAPERIYRSNFENEIQDLPKLSKEEFVQKFPHDYFSIQEKEQKVEKVILHKTADSKIVRLTSNDETLINKQGIATDLDLGKLPAGTYKLELYNIEGKDTIKTEKTFEVFDKRFLTDSQKPFLKVLQTKTEYKRSEKAKIFVYSAVPSALVNVYMQNGNGETITEQKSFKNGVLEYDLNFPKDQSIDQVNVQFQVVAFNDVQTESINLKISSDKKPLRIETVTFRDQLQPNSKEKWTVKILGDDNEKVSAEVLANMYDMSLDQFTVNSWSWQQLYQKYFKVNAYGINDNLAQEHYSKRIPYLNQKEIHIPEFRWFDGGIYGIPTISYQMESVSGIRNQEGVQKESVMHTSAKAKVAMDAGVPPPPPPPPASLESEHPGQDGPLENDDFKKIPVRQNLNETAFFYPNLMTDKDGNVTFEFTSPEALTQWKLMFLAHTKDARAAKLEKEVVTQKEFSVTPNYPRFLREGDELNLQSKLSSLVNRKLDGTAQLQILDAFTNRDITNKFVEIRQHSRAFELEENGNAVVNWNLKVPNDVSSIIIKVVAQAGNFSDGEQKAIAVLPNRMLVTDAVPIFVKEGQTKTFTLENLAKNNSTTATNVANTLELTTNPIWEIMFALPSLKNDQNGSADVIFNKWFADVLASEIFKANPKLKTVFDEYQSKGLLTSNLEKNQELKQLLLEETPWVLESVNETEQMQKLARLFDANTMRNSIQTDWAELKQLQNPDGGFSWHQGYPSSYYTSLYILKNLGKINEWLKGNMADYQGSEQKELVSKLIGFVDQEVSRYGNIDKKFVVNNFVLDYLDTRSYWEAQYPLKPKGTSLKNAVISKAKTEKITDFTFFGLHRLALLFDRYGMKTESKKFLTYLKETSTDTQTQGVYWKQNLNEWGWYSSKTVNHAGALEALNTLTPNDTDFIEEMKIWLVTQKEVNSWGSSRGTAEVIFTMLNSGKSWTSTESDDIDFTWGDKQFPRTTITTHYDDGNGGFYDRTKPVQVGYRKIVKKSDKIDKTLGTVTVTKPGPGIVQGGLFWQYYEDLDKIKSSESYISITKELYKKVKTVNGEELQKITSSIPLKVGDKVTVRMILNTDRNMEFIHLKDMRAAGFEPLNVISGYEWKNGLGYYQSTKDASTNFYIEYMPKGKYVFEYDYICNASGTFSNGITTLQNYYAPQMNAHTMGTRVTISE